MTSSSGQPAPGPNGDLAALPEEVIQEIVHKLRAKDLASVRQTSRAMADSADREWCREYLRITLDKMDSLESLAAAKPFNDEKFTMMVNAIHKHQQTILYRTRIPDDKQINDLLKKLTKKIEEVISILRGNRPRDGSESFYNNAPVLAEWVDQYANHLRDQLGQ